MRAFEIGPGIVMQNAGIERDEIEYRAAGSGGEQEAME